MKTRGWLLAVMAVMALSAQSALAASSNASQIGSLGVAGMTEVKQQEIAAGVADVLGADVAQSQIFDSSKGTFLVGLADVLGTADVGGQIADLWEAAVGVTGPGSKGALEVLNGVTSVAGAQAGSATTMAIGGGGGVIAGRQNGLMAERKALGNIDSALASFKMNQNFANRIWASPFYTRQGMDEKDGYNGYDYSAWGASVGYDHVFGSMIVGGAFTYSRGDFDADKISDDNTIDNYGFSLYGQYYNTSNGFFATLAGGYNYGDNEWKASIPAGQRITGENETDSYWFGASIGKDFFLGENWTVTPSIGLFWSESENSSYHTKVGATTFQRFGEIKSESLMLPIDLKAEYTTLLDECSSLSFNISGGYAYNLKSDGGRAEGNFQYAGVNQNIFIQGVKPGRSSWNLGAGVTYRKNNFDIGLNYRYDGRSKFDGHRVAATIGWNF